jgi:hypothetical protein
MTRKLDALVAERVMGWPFWDNEQGDWQGADDVTFWTFWDDTLSVYENGSEYPTLYFSPSTDMAAAWMVAEKMQDDGFECKLRLFSSDKDTSSATFCKNGYCREVEHKSMTFAVSTAALLAKGVTQDEIDAAMTQEITA